MKKYFLLTLLAVFLLPAIVLAHPPKKVKVEYNTETGILKIDMPHPVKDVNTHYIEKITISVNDKEVKVVEYKVQSSKDAHIAEIELPGLEKGSTVSINAKCNKMGSKKGELVIE